MKKHFFILFISAVLLGSCVSSGGLYEEYAPISKRLFSGDSEKRADAEKEFAKLSADKKKKVIINIARMLGRKKDPDTQIRMAAAIKRVSPGAYIIVPLIAAVKENKELRVVTTVKGIVSSAGPAEEGHADELARLLNEGGWRVKSLALFALGRMSKNAEKAVPEIIRQMQKHGRDAEKYVEIFDTLAMINPRVAVSALIADITNKDSEIRKNAAEKLLELQAYWGEKLKARSGITRAFIRALYDTDKELSEFTENALKQIEDRDVKKEAEGYLKMSGSALKTLLKAAGKDAEKIFEKQKEEVLQSIKKFYEEIGKKGEFEDIKGVWE